MLLYNRLWIATLLDRLLQSWHIMWALELRDRRNQEPADSESTDLNHNSQSKQAPGYMRNIVHKRTGLVVRQTACTVSTSTAASESGFMCRSDYARPSVALEG